MIASNKVQRASSDGMYAMQIRVESSKKSVSRSGRDRRVVPLAMNSVGGSSLRAARHMRIN